MAAKPGRKPKRTVTDMIRLADRLRYTSPGDSLNADKMAINRSGGGMGRIALKYLFQFTPQSIHKVLKNTLAELGYDGRLMDFVTEQRAKFLKLCLDGKMPDANALRVLDKLEELAIALASQSTLLDKADEPVKPESYLDWQKRAAGKVG